MYLSLKDVSTSVSLSFVMLSVDVLRRNDGSGGLVAPLSTGGSGGLVAPLSTVIVRTMLAVAPRDGITPATLSSNFYQVYPVETLAMLVP